MESTLLSHLSVLILLSVLSTFVGFGFQRMMEPEMIFYSYHNLLNTIYHKHVLLAYFTKPLGMCIICNSTWIGIILTFVFIPEFNWFIVISAIIVGCITAGLVSLLNTKYHLLKNKL